MKKVLLVYLPFCTPASPPYSITNLYSFLKNNYDGEVDVLDLNLEFHKIKFPEYQKYFKNMDLWEDYDQVTRQYIKETTKTYSESNHLVVDGKQPELLHELISKIKEKKPDIVAFSIVYSSQALYGYAVIKELKEYITIIGGPAVNEQLSAIASKTLKSEIELINYLSPNKTEFNFDYTTDFSVYDLDSYFTPHPVIPIKTSSGCYYQQCAYCSHHNNIKYFEYPMDIIIRNIINSKQKYFFIIDDMMPLKRLLLFAQLVKPLGIKWVCQLKPTKEFTETNLRILKESGAVMLMWGVESGNDRILKLMKKATNSKDIENVLKASHDAGIRNVAYIMFGFPTETKQEFLETVDFLKKNEINIDLVSVSIFGLQKNTPAYNHPDQFGITKVIEVKRTVLEPRISYECATGLSQDEAAKLRKNYTRTLEKINKFPKRMNFFREHMMF